MFKALGNFINKYNIAVLVASVVFIVLAGWYGLGVFPHLDKGNMSDRDSESTKVVDKVRTDFSKGSPQVMVLFVAPNGQTVDTPAFAQEVQRLLSGVRSDIVSSTSYYNTGSLKMVSKDKKSTFATLVLPGDISQQSDQIDSMRQKLKSNKLESLVGGVAAINADVTSQIHQDLAMAEGISFAALAVLLVIVFRSVIAALLPLLLGGFAILGAFFVTRLLTLVTPISQYAINIITLLGLGLAIDYSLFMVSRFREELHESRDVDKALARTVETSGHTIFFSALTVIASLMCLQVFPIDFLRSMSWGGAAAVLVALVAAMLVLPAILRLLGVHIDAWSFGSAKRYAEAFKKGHQVEERQTIWYKAGRVFMRFRYLSLAVAVAVLVFAGLPFLRIHFSSSDYRTLPEGSESRTVAERMERDFGNPSAPLRIIYTSAGPITSSAEIAKLQGYVAKVNQLTNVTGTTSLVDLPGVTSLRQYQMIYEHPSPQIQALIDERVSGNSTLIDVNFAGEMDSPIAQQLVSDVRSIPKPDGATALVGAGPAVLHDLLITLGTYIPYGLAVLLVLLFVLLFALSRSVVIPIQAILLSALSLSAAFGALVWIFQDGNLAGLLHVTSTGGIDATMPVLVFAVAFGLSVDYSVFLYSRIKEQYDASGGDNAEAVLTGLQKTGTIITSAAVLLFIVVAAFAAGRITIMQQVGVGLGLTVLIDAFVIRMVLVPSLMGILNHANWWAPKFLKGKNHEQTTSKR